MRRPNKNVFYEPWGHPWDKGKPLGQRGAKNKKTKKKKPSHGSRAVDKNAKTIKNPDTAMHRGIVSVHAMDTHMNMSALQLTPLRACFFC